MTPLATLTLVLFTLSIVDVRGQHCPGGGTQFSNAVIFDPTWLSGCNTGTSCNGAVNSFDNRVACEPTAALDPCAPTASCGNPANSASDIWYKFYAESTTATIKVIQNVSFVVVIQAFSGGATCGTLTQIGCVISAGPSSGATLSLSGLTAGQLYYFRVFGSAASAAQRTGVYCFCGTTGLLNRIVPTVLKSFTANTRNTYNILNWSLEADTDLMYIEVQKSFDGRNFFGIKNIVPIGGEHDYSYTEKIPEGNSTTYYRLKLGLQSGEAKYSSALYLKTKGKSGITVLSNTPGKGIEIQTDDPVQLNLFNAIGKLIGSYAMNSGRNSIATGHLSNGVYFLQNTSTHSGIKIMVVND